MILIISYGGGHIRIAEQVYLELLKQGQNCLILPLTTAESYLSEREVGHLKLHKLFDEYVKSEEIKISSDEEKFITEESKKNYDSSKVGNKHTFAYYFLGLSELFQKHGFSKGKELYKNLNRRAFEPLNFSKWLIEKYMCNLVITTNVDRYEFAFRASAKVNNIPVMSFDDLFGEFANENKILSDIICVDNEIAKINIQNMGYLGKIEITGNPVFNLIKPANPSLEIKNSALIVLTTGVSGLKLFENFKTFDDFFHKNFFSTIETYLLNNFLKVKVRFHPSMTKKKYWINDSFEIDNENDFHKSLEKSETIIGLNCTTAIYEAYLSGKSIINFNYSNTSKYRNLPIPSLGYVNDQGFIEEFSSDKLVKLRKTKSFRPSFGTIFKKLINELLPNY